MRVLRLPIAVMVSSLCFLRMMAGCSAANGMERWTIQNESEYTYVHDGCEYRICIECVDDSMYILHHKKDGQELSSWELPYPVYRFCCGNLAGDSLPEIAVGVIKPTRYFPVPDKRLFIFKLYKGRLIRPLWLGSRVGFPIEDFCMELPSSADSIGFMRIHTMERKHDGSIVEALYKYGGFGLKFEKYIDRQ